MLWLCVLFARPGNLNNNDTFESQNNREICNCNSPGTCNYLKLLAPNLVRFRQTPRTDLSPKNFHLQGLSPFADPKNPISLGIVRPPRSLDYTYWPHHYNIIYGRTNSIPYSLTGHVQNETPKENTLNHCALILLILSSAMCPLPPSAQIVFCSLYNTRSSSTRWGTGPMYCNHSLRLDIPIRITSFSSACLFNKSSTGNSTDHSTTESQQKMAKGEEGIRFVKIRCMNIKEKEINRNTRQIRIRSEA